MTSRHSALALGIGHVILHRLPGAARSWSPWSEGDRRSMLKGIIILPTTAKGLVLGQVWRGALPFPATKIGIWHQVHWGQLQTSDNDITLFWEGSAEQTMGGGRKITLVKNEPSSDDFIRICRTSCWLPFLYWDLYLSTYKGKRVKKHSRVIC